jgi:hypothetical protein
VPERLAAHRPQIEQWLAEGLRLTKIYRRLREQGVTVPYSSLHRFAQAQLGFGTPAITVRVAEPPAGEVAEADFGVLGYWTDPATHQRRSVHGLLVTLCHTRYAFLAVSLRQDLPAVLAGLEEARRHGPSSAASSSGWSSIISSPQSRGQIATRPPWIASSSSTRSSAASSSTPLSRAMTRLLPRYASIRNVTIDCYWKLRRGGRCPTLC